MLNTIKYALNIYKEKDKWNKLIYEGMNSINNWDKSSEEYIEIYEKLNGFRGV